MKSVISEVNSSTPRDIFPVSPKDVNLHLNEKVYLSYLKIES